jgi:murein DD-endopeptidase MepM/ murein hydrolase activator NlpD
VVADGRAPAEVGPSRRIVEGVVEVSFYASAARADVPDETIAQAAEVLGWDLDFGKLQAGSTFSIQFEQRRSPASGETLPGRLLSVRIVEVGGELHEGIWFQQPGEKVGGFYTSKGQALSRDYLRYPVSFTRISSGFADARVHPVLNFTRPHYGVDLAAPAGTPVHAISDGNVELAAWQGGYGRWVQIRHDDTFESGYGHLSRIAPDIRPGCAVRKGDVIGYVGSTGITTGPHLHFAIYKNGKYIDPLSAEAPRSRSLAGSSAERFRDQVRKVEAAYAAAGRAGGDLVLVATAGAATGVLDGTAARWDSASASIGR